MSTEDENVADAVRRERIVAGTRRTLAWGALAAVPVALAAVYTLPEPIRRSLAFEYGEPTVLTAYAAPFVHLDLAHLLVNLTGYALVVPVAYALAVASGRRRQFWTGFVTFVCAFPPILSALNLAVPRAAYGIGFSGVVLAFVGYLALGMADHLDARFGVGPRRLVAPAVFFAGLALVAALSLRAVVPSREIVALGTGGLVVATALAALAFWLAAADAGGGTSRPRPGETGGGHVELLLLAGVLFVGMQFVAFPADPRRGGDVVNLYVHLLGYALGFTSAYASTMVEGSVSRAVLAARPG